MLIFHKGHTDAIQVYSVSVMTHVKALQAGHSSQGTSEPITPGECPCMNCGVDSPPRCKRITNYGNDLTRYSDIYIAYNIYFDDADFSDILPIMLHR